MARVENAAPRKKLARASAALALAVWAGLAATGCAHRARRPPTATRRPPPPAPTRTAPSRAPIVQGETGIASWYGHPYHGRKTANGETYNMYEMTAAHRTLPFNTQVRVHDLENGKDVQVRINDRGPFVEGRIIDLSYASAQAMGMPSIARVSLEILGRSSPGGTGSGTASEPGSFGVQVGAFKDRRNAEKLKGSIEQQFAPVTIQTFDRGDAVFYRIRVGRENSEDGAYALAQKLVQAGFAIQTFVVRLD
jgi:rare lipoprotein A